MLPLELFGKKNNTARGYRYWCKPCSALQSREYVANNPNRKKKPVCKEKKSQWDARYRERNRDALVQAKKMYYIRNKDAISARAKLHYQNNSEEIKRRVAEYKKNNPGKVNAWCMKRYTDKLCATPSWLSDDDLWMIEEAYHLAKLREEVVGGKWDVDHIVPLRGKKVCGLHVPWNLAVIRAEANRSKGNKFDVK
jgi:hypothetical protein